MWVDSEVMESGVAIIGKFYLTRERESQRHPPNIIKKCAESCSNEDGKKEREKMK